LSYYNEKPVYQQVKEILAANPKLSRKEALSMVTRGNQWDRSNRARPRLQGSSEVARRQRQVAKGFIKVN
jgi:hypothetical protein